MGVDGVDGVDPVDPVDPVDQVDQVDGVSGREEVALGEVNPKQGRNCNRRTGY